MIRAGDVSSRELVDASLERIEALNGELNAFIHVDADEARAAADAIGADDERPFAGVPLAIKDIGPAWAGRPLTFAADLFGDFVPQFDGAVVRRFKDAGFVPVGKTNAPEFGILPVTEPRRYGPARNPWDTDRTPGGSSGGSAAAVASGMVPIAHANDGGGSIRIPAACCGLVGLKPSRGRVSMAPVMGESFLAIDGVVSRTVADTALSLDVLAGYELGDASWAPEPARPVRQRGRKRPRAAAHRLLQAPPAGRRRGRPGQPGGGGRDGDAAGVPGARGGDLRPGLAGARAVRGVQRPVGGGDRHDRPLRGHGQRPRADRGLDGAAVVGAVPARARHQRLRLRPGAWWRCRPTPASWSASWPPTTRS